MSAAKHTPGPWEVKHTKVGNTPTLCAVDGIVLSTDRPRVELEANVNLCAAAPDMIEALKNILAVKLPGYIADGVHHDNKAHVLARTALAKAGGL